MQKIFFTVSLFVMVTLLFSRNSNAQNSNPSQSFLRHMVIITFKPDASPDSIQALDNLYKGLSKSPVVKDFETGVNVSVRDSGVVKHVYLTTFASREDMKEYSKIPQYGRLFKISLPIADDVTVVDYWIEK